MHGKAAFLAKNLQPSLVPLKYRILLILAILYRRWAGLRLRNLDSWIRNWQLDEIFAGVRGGCAEDAWWGTALLIEHARVQDIPVAGGSAAIFKCEA